MYMEEETEKEKGKEKEEDKVMDSNLLHGGDDKEGKEQKEEKEIENERIEEELLNDLWALYFHDPLNSDWNLSSYIRIEDISTVQGFWKAHDLLKSNVHLGMFFLMREYVFPCWDDPNNKDGGCISIKVLKNESLVFWEKMCIALLGETLLKEPSRAKLWSSVNGISTSPKKHFCIVKIWLKEAIDLAMFNFPPGFYGEILYKANAENIGS